MWRICKGQHEPLKTDELHRLFIIRVPLWVSDCGTMWNNGRKTVESLLDSSNTNTTSLSLSPSLSDSQGWGICFLCPTCGGPAFNTHTHTHTPLFTLLLSYLTHWTHYRNILKTHTSDVCVSECVCMTPWFMLNVLMTLSLIACPFQCHLALGFCVNVLMLSPQYQQGCCPHLIWSPCW